MNHKDTRYTRYALIKEMLETPDVMRNFDPACVLPFCEEVKKSRGLFLTGEGSSRIFPAKKAVYERMRKNYSVPVMTEGATQAMEYDLRDYTVFAASNSGQTKEVVRLLTKLRGEGHDKLFGVTANKDTKLEQLSSRTNILNCGKEDAVAATKSVVEQALFYDALQHLLEGIGTGFARGAAGAFERALSISIDEEIVKKIAAAPVIWFAGRNNGVAEELALKTNEITRKRSGYLEGTYAVHGIEEVMNPGEVLIWINPFSEEQDKFAEVLEKGVGMTVIAIAPTQTRFSTVVIPESGDNSPYTELAAGWNLLVETGLALGINLDKPTRARKVGNEYLPS
ncbi:MAG TPA: SIS domain-containing protein [Bacteroidales bacterium]|nr:SIS domain-containing protein [Bacteroidales bacterium]